MKTKEQSSHTKEYVSKTKKHLEAFIADQKLLIGHQGAFGIWGNVKMCNI